MSQFLTIKSKEEFYETIIYDFAYIFWGHFS